MTELPDPAAGVRCLFHRTTSPPRNVRSPRRATRSLLTPANHARNHQIAAEQRCKSRPKTVRLQPRMAQRFMGHPASPHSTVRTARDAARFAQHLDMALILLPKLSACQLRGQVRLLPLT
jgi:hypothetical protein